MANELDAYTLVDRGTWLAHQSNIKHLKVLVEGDPRLYNRYGIIAVNPDRFNSINHAGAMLFINWITSREGQKLIENYKIDNLSLFFPLAVTD